MRTRTAVLIACKNGEATVGSTIDSAINQADVYVVSDGSHDGTCDIATRAGATVLETATSVGKPAALRAGSQAFSLPERYDYIAVLDDDTTLESGYVYKVTRPMDADSSIAATSGRIDAIWTHARRWNLLVAMRAFMYWSYQVTVKRGQNALRVVNVICGANTVFRADVFEKLIVEDAPYAIDDMYWIAEIVRRRLGRVAYVHGARSWTIDPHRFLDWYRQTVRWSWGQFQSVRGHRLGVPLRRDRTSRIGVRFSWFDTAYLALLVDWFPYMIEPLVLPPLAYFLRSWIHPVWFLVYYVAASLGWIALGALALRKPRLLLLAPAIMALDIVYRFAMLHALIKTIRFPRVETCAWDSPARFALERAHPVSVRGISKETT